VSDGVKYRQTSHTSQNYGLVLSHLSCGGRSQERSFVASRLGDPDVVAGEYFRYPEDTKDQQRPMNTDSYVVLIAGTPTHLRSALQALLSSITTIQMVMTADTQQKTLELAATHTPKLVILLPGLEDFSGHFCEMLREVSPGVRLAVITDNVVGETDHASHADRVIQQGLPPDKLVTTLEQLLP
jgi:hypothetical protein